MLLILGLWFHSASAATVAVLDFQSWGASEADAQSATEALRGALLTAGRLDSLPGSDIAAGVSASNEPALRAARDHAAEARRLYLSGDFPGAISAATEAVSEHADALSQIGRRPEVADAWYTLGVACARSGLAANASDAFMHVARLYPRYLEERATNVPAGARTMLADAEAAVDQPQLSRVEIGEARAALHVDWIVTGSLDADGALEVQLWGPDPDDAAMELDLRGFHVTLPPPDVDETWSTLASRLATKALALANPAAPVVHAPPATEAADPEDEPAAADDRLTRHWWFWAGAGAAVGAGALIGYAVWEPPPVDVAGPDTWSVRVDAP